MRKLRLCENEVAIGTIAGGAVNEPVDIRLAALWRHDSAKAALPPEVRASLIRQASGHVVGGDA